jgi:hypothetical protein
MGAWELESKDFFLSLLKFQQATKRKLSLPSTFFILLFLLGQLKGKKVPNGKEERLLTRNAKMAF